MRIQAGRTRLRLHPLMLMFPALTSALGHRGDATALLASLAVHEGAHLLAARAAGIRVTELRLMPFGGAARLGNLYALPPGHLWAIAAAGPAANLIVLLTASALCQWGWLRVASALALTRVNLTLMLFNLLPALPLDGGRMLYALTCKRLGRGRAAGLGIALGRALSLGLLGLALRGLWVTRRLNLSLVACALFILASASEERRALSDLGAVTLLNALRHPDRPVEMRLCAVSADCPAMTALRHAAPDAATLYAVYENDALSAFADERQLLNVALASPTAPVREAIAG